MRPHAARTLASDRGSAPELAENRLDRPRREGAWAGTWLAMVLPVLLILAAACRGADVPEGGGPARADAPGTGTPIALDPCAVALAQAAGSAVPDPAIADLQDQARAAADPIPVMERLGWTYVEKARLTYDPGFYDLAEQTALCMEGRRPASPEALLLRGHVLHNLHRFREGEALARELVIRRGDAFDWGLLGDLLMEQGKLEEAAPAYQRMVDMRPGLQAYSRAAHMRWLKGDLPGAIEVMRMAVQAASPRNGESAAWAYAKLALYELQAGDLARAMAACESALRLVDGYAPALLVRGQILLARDEATKAVEPLRQAAASNPLPEYQWALAEALRSAGRGGEADSVEATLLRRGESEDPRTFALYLATRGAEVETAVRLAREELERRSDVLTRDVLAWALAAGGRTAEARAAIEPALAGGTQDARLFYHAGVIARMAGEAQEARRWLARASEMRQMLLPAERDRLSQELAAL